jgi:hypothetical protein
VLHINSVTGLVEVNSNATSSLGLTTKIYVDSEIQAATSFGDVNLQANLAIINANLAARINAENSLNANITAANAQIELRDTIARVNSINTSIDTALTANVNAIFANLSERVNQTVAVNTAMIANVAAANLNVNGANVTISQLSSRLDSVNTAIDIALTTNLATKADTFSPSLTGIPTTTTAAVDTSSAQIASAAYVMNTLGANILPRIAAVGTAMIANVAAANALITSSNINLTELSNRLDSVNSAIDVSLQANLALKANVANPTFTGTPTAPTAAFGANSSQIATTQYVMTRSAFWDGSRKFISTSDPSTSDGSNGDIWFKYIP